MAMFATHNTGKDDYLRDNNLSLKSKGLLAIMLNTEYWDRTRIELQKLTKESEYAITSVLKELEDHRYIVSHKTVTETASVKIVKYTYDVFDTKQMALHDDY